MNEYWALGWMVSAQKWYFKETRHGTLGFRWCFTWSLELVLLVCAYPAHSSCVVSLWASVLFVIIMEWAADECREDQMLWDI